MRLALPPDVQAKVDFWEKVQEVTGTLNGDEKRALRYITEIARSHSDWKEDPTPTAEVRSALMAQRNDGNRSSRLPAAAELLVNKHLPKKVRLSHPLAEYADPGSWRLPNDREMEDAKKKALAELHGRRLSRFNWPIYELAQNLAVWWDWLPPAGDRDDRGSSLSYTKNNLADGTECSTPFMHLLCLAATDAGIWTERPKRDTVAEIIVTARKLLPG